MRLVSFVSGGRPSFGAVTGDAVTDLGLRMPDGLRSLDAVLAAGALDRVRSVAAGAEPDLALDTLDLDIPVRRPGKILCVGVNYANRNAEYRDGSELPKYPSLFMRTPLSFVGHRRPIVRPPESPQLDYEGEIVLVIGRGGRRIPEDRAWEHVAGLTVMNEGTIRDWVRHAKFNVTQGKNFDRTGAIGPWMVSLDAVDRSTPLRVVTRVNGEVRQDDDTDSMMFPIPALLAYISSFTTLEPGDLIATGTPTGAGARFDPPRYLVPGDEVEVEVPGVGTLCNRVEDEVAD